MFTSNNNELDSREVIADVNIIGKCFGGIPVEGLGFLSTVSSLSKSKSGSWFERILYVVTQNELNHGDNVAIVGKICNKQIKMPYTYNKEDGQICIAKDEDGNPHVKENFPLHYVEGPVAVFESEVPNERHTTRCACTLRVVSGMRQYHNSNSLMFQAITGNNVPVYGHITRRYHASQFTENKSTFIIGHLESEEGPPERLDGWVGENGEVAMVQPLWHRIPIEVIPSYRSSGSRGGNNNFQANIAQQNAIGGQAGYVSPPGTNSNSNDAQNSGMISQFASSGIQ